MLRKHGAGEHRIHDFSAPDGGCGRRSFSGIENSRVTSLNLARVLAAVAVVLALGACATRPINPPLAHFDPQAGYRWSNRPDLPRNDRETLLILAFSGGGTRAAAFSFGVLEELRRTPVGLAAEGHTMLTEVDLISGVSGGSFTALAYALQGEQMFDSYPPNFSTATSNPSCSASCSIP